MPALDPNQSGSFGNARFLGLAADLAYLNGPDGPAKFQSELGLDARLVAVDNTQAYVGENDSHIVVAFRGSENPASLDGLKDWLLTNALNLLVIPEGRIGTDFMAAGVGARFHFGFMSALDEVWEGLKNAVDAAVARKERPVWVTGHSLGGALALLAAWRLEQQFVTVHQVYTFGAPMVGNEAAAKAFESAFAGRVFRFVDTSDFVPRLPTISLVTNPFLHCPKEIMLGQSSGSGALSALAGFAGKAVNGAISGTLADDLWKLVVGHIDAHLMGNYNKRIGEQG
jgi:triacylglycerol lipase